MQRCEKKKNNNNNNNNNKETEKSKMIGISLNAVHRHDRKG